MRIVFMGTPDFAAPCLARLLDDGHEVAGVFSQPDRPKGRGHKLSPPPVKEFAQSRGIAVYQPEKLRDGTALALLQTLAPELIVVVAYGRILPKEILDLPQYGCVNVHASLLPKLRGAAPIQWAVINGDKVTGVTTMFMAEGLDTGDTLLMAQTPIGAEETAGELFERLAMLGADLLAETVQQLADGTAQRKPQDDTLATHAPMLDKKLANLDFNKSPEELCNLIRGLNPSPMAFSRLDGKVVKILAARPDFLHHGAAGEILDAKRLIVGCNGGAIELLQVRPEGKKPMSGEEFARGKRLANGQMFTLDSHYIL